MSYERPHSVLFVTGIYTPYMIWITVQFVCFNVSWQLMFAWIGRSIYGAINIHKVRLQMFWSVYVCVCI